MGLIISGIPYTDEAPDNYTLAVSGHNAEQEAAASGGGGALGPDTVGTSEIVDGSIVNADISASAAIAESKIANLVSDLASKINAATLDANTILYATSDDTPAALTVGASTVVGRAASGNIVALSIDQLKTLLQPRVNTLTVSSNTYTPNADTTDIALISSPTANFTVAAPTGTPVNGQRLSIRMTSGATGYVPTWDAAFISSGVATLPSTALPVSKTMTAFFSYDTSNSKWVLMAYDPTGY